MLTANIKNTPFGTILDERTYGISSRIGFNSKERDDEIKGVGDSYDFGDRIQDPRLGMWLSLDASSKKYPGISSYTFSFDNPIIFNDPDGKDARLTIQKDANGGGTITLETTVHIFGANSKDKASELNKTFENLNPGPQTFEVDGKKWTVVVKINYTETNKEVLEKTTEFNRGVTLNGTFDDTNFEKSNLKDFKGGDNILLMDQKIDLSFAGNGTVGASGVGSFAGAVGPGSDNKTAVHETFHMLGFNDIAGLGEKGPDLMEYNDAGQTSIKELHFYDIVKYATANKLETGTHVFEDSKKINIDTDKNYDSQTNVKASQKEAKANKVVEKK